MADQPVPPPATALVIPSETELRFAEIIILIKGSESMNDEERQYWINILPIMTQEQLKNLEEILASEKKQLAAIDEKYAKQTTDKESAAAVSTMGEKIRSKKQKREETEREEAQKEATTEDQLLSQIQSL